MKCKAFLIAVASLSLPGTAFAVVLADFDSLIPMAYASLVGILGFVFKHIDWLGLLWLVVQMAAVSMIISAVILRICRKKQLFKRRNPVWDKLSCLYYILIPVCMFVASVLVAVPNYVAKMSENLIMRGVVPILNVAVSRSVESLPPNAAELLQKSPEEYFANAMSGVLRDPSSRAGKGGDLLAGAWDSVGEDTRAWFVGQAAAMIASKATGGDVETVEEGLRVFHKQKLKDSVLTVADQLGRLATVQINKVIHRYQRLCLLVPVGIGLIPVFDVLIAFWLGRRRRKPEEKGRHEVQAEPPGREESFIDQAVESFIPDSCKVRPEPGRPPIADSPGTTSLMRAGLAAGTLFLGGVMRGLSAALLLGVGVALAYFNHLAETMGGANLLKFLIGLGLKPYLLAGLVFEPKLLIAFLLWLFVPIYAGFGIFYGGRRALACVIAPHSGAMAERLAFVVARRRNSTPRLDNAADKVRQWIDEDNVSQEMESVVGSGKWARRVTRFAAKRLRWKELLADWDAHPDGASLHVVLSPRIARAINEAATPSLRLFKLFVGTQIVLFVVGRWIL